MTTTRLSLPTPTGTDLISAGDDAIADGNTVLDDAAMWEAGTFAGRPAAADLDGKFYLATDVGIVYVSDGSSWIEVSRGGGTVPIGASLDYAGSADPADTRFVLADGRAISRSTYAAAFAIMGTAFGVGNGTTTFNIPDYRGRSSVGPDDMGTAQGAAGRLASNNTRGASGGVETRSLVTGNLPAHTHDQGSLGNDTSATHTHAAGTYALASQADHAHGVGTYAGAATSAGTPAGTLSSDSAGTPSGTVSAVSAGTPAGSTGNNSVAHTHSGTTASDTHSHGINPFSGSDIESSIGWSSGITGHGTVQTQTDAHTHTFTTGGNSANHTHAFVGTALGTHVHAFTGSALGTHDHDFTGSALATHSHVLSGSSASAGGHTHTMSGASDAGGAHTHTITGATGSTGSGTAFNIMGPYVVANKIIRIS